MKLKRIISEAIGMTIARKWIDEEYYVEEFGYVMSDKGIFSVIEDFLGDYENEILTLKNQEGGIKWMQQFIQK